MTKKSGLQQLDALLCFLKYVLATISKGHPEASRLFIQKKKAVSNIL